MTSLTAGLVGLVELRACGSPTIELAYFRGVLSPTLEPTALPTSEVRVRVGGLGVLRTGPTGLTWRLTSVPLWLNSAWLRHFFWHILKWQEGMGEGWGGYGRLREW